MTIKMNDVLVDVKNLCKYFTISKGFLTSEKELLYAVNDVSFYIKKGETFSIVGETGSGKTTIAKMIMRFIEPTSGEIWFDGKNIGEMDKKQLQPIRRSIQMIFQDPSSSLNPRVRVGDIVGLPLQTQNIAKGEEKRMKVIELLEIVGLKPGNKIIDRYPHEFSGGQKQRIGIARAIALNPSFIVADEPVSSLDISIRAQILNLLNDLKKQFNLTYLMILHDLSVVKLVSDRVFVMYLGKGMEIGKVKDIFDNPLHPYTKTLISSVPSTDPMITRERIKLVGEMPSPINPPKGCIFNTRCPYCKDKCFTIEPIFEEVRPEHRVACHFWEELE